MRLPEFEYWFEVVTQVVGGVSEDSDVSGCFWYFCSVANEDHLAEDRSFMHTFHEDHQVCVASRGMERLDVPHAVGILLHEMGHLLLGIEAEEIEIDVVIVDVLGIQIQYDDEEIQYVDTPDLDKLIELYEQSD